MAKSMDDRISEAFEAGVCPDCGQKLATEPNGEGVHPGKHAVAHYGRDRLSADTSPDAAKIQRQLEKRGRELDDKIEANREQEAKE